MSEKNLREVEILKEYYEQIEKIIVQSRQFRTVDEYVNFVLKEILFGEEDTETTEKTEKLLKQRFQDLGYL